jgi:hypothetical protein
MEPCFGEEYRMFPCQRSGGETWYPGMLLQEMESEGDMRRFKELYPNVAKEILPWVEDLCDQMEYDGSIMFDVYPDRWMMARLIRQIMAHLKNQSEEIRAQVEVLLYQEMCQRRRRRRNRGSKFQDWT